MTSVRWAILTGLRLALFEQVRVNSTRGLQRAMIAVPMLACSAIKLSLSFNG
jgi:hypothetical protein